MPPFRVICIEELFQLPAGTLISSGIVLSVLSYLFWAVFKDRHEV